MCNLFAVWSWQHAVCCCTCRVAGYGQGVHKAAVPLGKTKLSNARVEQAGLPYVLVLKKSHWRPCDAVADD